MEQLLKEWEWKGRDRCLDVTRSTRCEYGICYREDGQIEYEAKGDEGSVDLYQGPEIASVIHSHPSSASLSDADVTGMLEYAGNKIIAVCEDDGIYVASCPKGADSFLHRLTAVEGYKQAVSLAWHIFHDKLGVKEPENDDFAQLVGGHIMASLSGNKGLIDYRFREGWKLRKGMDEFQKRIAEHPDLDILQKILNKVRARGQ